MDVQKNPKGSPLLHFSALCDLLETSKKTSKFFSSIFSLLRQPDLRQRLMKKAPKVTLKPLAISEPK